MTTENIAAVSKFMSFFDTTKKTKQKEEPCLKELKKQLFESKLELEAALTNFNNVTDPKLIDVYIYKIQSEEARFEKILSEIKEIVIIKKRS